MSNGDVFPSYTAAKATSLVLRDAIFARDWTPWSISHGGVERKGTLNNLIRFFIESSEGKKSSVFLPRETLDVKVIICPYWYAMFGACIAVAEAYHEYNRRQNAADYLEKMKNVNSDIDDLKKAISKFTGNYNASDFFLPALRPSIVISGDVLKERMLAANACYDNVYAASFDIFENIDVLRSYSSESVEILSRTGTEGFVMHQTFAERIGMTWCELTGKAPTPTQKRFMQFLQASYVFVGGSEFRNWDNIVKTICERMDKTPDKYKHASCGGWDHGNADREHAYYHEDRKVELFLYKFRRGGIVRRMAEMYVKSPINSDERAAAYLFLKEEFQIDAKTPIGEKWIDATLSGEDMSDFWQKNSERQE